MISKFSVECFRCFKECQTLEVAIPDHEYNGSGLTYLVGKNNAGKTTTLEGMHCQDNSTHSQYSRLRSSDIIDDRSSFTYFDERDNVVQKLTQIRPKSYSLKNVAKGDRAEDFSSHLPVFIPSRRYWSSRTNGDIQDINAIRNQTYESALRQTPDNYGSHSGDVASLFYYIEHDDSMYEKFLENMRIVFPSFESFTLVNEDYASVSYTTKDGITHKTDFLGDGVSSVMRIIATIVAHPDRLIVIDEPELSLHPEAQKNLLHVLASFAKDMQILISTHSAQMISWEYFKNGAKINRVTKVPKIGSIIRTLSDYSVYESLLNDSSWNQPYALDVVSKEIFFNDDILFLEGQDDVGLLRNIGKLAPHINLFGYGVRGFCNFKFALKLAKDLGIQRAGVILDKGNDEDEELIKLSRDYSPDYLVAQWDREDIRDKAAYYPADANGAPDTAHMKKAKFGYFTEHGKFKSNDYGDFYNKIAMVNEYFK